MKFLNSKILSAVMVSVVSLQLAACSSPPEPPQPMGEKIAINPQVSPKPTVKPQENPVLVNDLEPVKPALVTSTRQVDVHEFDEINPKYRK